MALWAWPRSDLYEAGCVRIGRYLSPKSIYPALLLPRTLVIKVISRRGVVSRLVVVVESAVVLLLVAAEYYCYVSI